MIDILILILSPTLEARQSSTHWEPMDLEIETEGSLNSRVIKSRQTRILHLMIISKIKVESLRGRG